VLDCTHGPDRWPECEEDRAGIAYDVLITVRPATNNGKDPQISKEIHGADYSRYAADKFGFRRRVSSDLGTTAQHSGIAIFSQPEVRHEEADSGTVNLAGCHGVIQLSHSDNIAVYLQGEAGTDGPCRLRGSEEMAVTFSHGISDSEPEIEWDNTGLPQLEYQPASANTSQGIPSLVTDSSASESDCQEAQAV
jgi:hypothetical protein